MGSGDSEPKNHPLLYRPIPQPPKFQIPGCSDSWPKETFKWLDSVLLKNFHKHFQAQHRQQDVHTANGQWQGSIFTEALQASVIYFCLLSWTQRYELFLFTQKQQRNYWRNELDQYKPSAHTNRSRAYSLCVTATGNGLNWLHIEALVVVLIELLQHKCNMLRYVGSFVFTVHITVNRWLLQCSDTHRQ